jgi:glycosyltransferase involved in cell wall biosynthesis
VIVYIYPADPFGCGEYRLAMPGRAARDIGGLDVRIFMPAERDGIGGAIDMKTGKLVNLRYPPDADVIVLQRVAYDTLAQAIPIMRNRGVAVIVDMDDALTRIDPANPAWWGFRADWGSPLHTARNCESACRDATMVTVSTPALIPLYAGSAQRGAVLSNCVPERYLSLPHDDAATVGWAGSLHSHPRDLEVLGPSIARIVRDGYEYWGAGPDYAREPGDGGLHRMLGLTGEHDQRLEVGTTGNVADIRHWGNAVATMGVGIAPLTDTEFNRAKSWLKPLEYMACGVPWVGSPRAEYRALRDLTSVGLLAEQPRDWYSRLKLLMTDGELRRAQSAAGRAAIVEHGLTYEASWWRWAETWERALKMQRRQHRASTVIA